MFGQLIAVAFAAVFPGQCGPALGERLYVKADAVGCDNGGSWNDAFTDFQSALAVAAAARGGVAEIWVAAGTFKPADPNGDRTVSFQLPSGVKVFGHFAGSERSLFERDLSSPLNETSLSGDLNGDDGADFVGYDENSFHVVSAAAVNSATQFDGFTIRAGYANGPVDEFSLGGGMVGDPEDEDGSPVISNCRFVANRAVTGGGAWSWDSTSHPWVINCRFEGNHSDNCGGAVYVGQHVSPAFVNCVFTGNTGELAGGAVCLYDSLPTLTNCTFFDNSAGIYGGGGVYVVSAYPTLRNCVLWSNQSESVTGQQIAVNNCLTILTVESCDVEAGMDGVWLPRGLDNCLIDWSPTSIAVDPLLLPGGALAAGSPCIDAGNAELLPADAADLDLDGDLREATPLDVLLTPRTQNAQVDIGAHEWTNVRMVTILAANPPLDNPFVAGQQPFRDVLQTGPADSLSQGIGADGTPAADSIVYAPITVTFSETPTPAPSATNIVVVCSGALPSRCPTVVSVAGAGSGPYAIALSGAIPPGGCTALTFAGTAPGASLRYQSLPADVDLNGTSSTADVLALVVALNTPGSTGTPANLPRLDMNRSGSYGTADILRLLQLLNGVNTTRVWAGAAVAPCP